MARKRKKPKPVIQRETVLVNPKTGEWRTRCLCEPGCAEYRCCSCRHEWRPTPSKEPCPECGSIYFEWANYSSWCRSHT